MQIDKSSSKEFKDKYIVIAIDITGISYEQQISVDEKEMECEKERYLKIHVAVNVKTKQENFSFHNEGGNRRRARS